MTSRFERFAPGAAFVIPWMTACLGVSGSPSWATDVAIARTYGALPAGFEGLVSAALGGAFSLIPVGSPITRAGTASALALGVCGLLVFRLARRLLSARNEPGALEAALALLSALSATLGPSFLLESTVMGGASVAAALALGALDMASGSPTRRAGVVCGALLAATLCESRFAALVLALSLAVLVSVGRANYERGFASALALGAATLGALPLALVVGVLASPSRSTADLFASAAPRDLTALNASADAIGAWTSSAGVVWAALGALGFCLGAWRRSSRALSLSLLSTLGFGAFGSAAAIPPTFSDPLAATRLLGIAALSIATSLGVGIAARALHATRLPLARAASVLLVVYGFSVVFVGAEDAARAAELRDSNLAERWADEALQSLPPKSILLLRSEPIFRRLEAARVLGGSRPDLLIVPTRAIDQTATRLGLVEKEAALMPIVRDVLLTGKASELSLTGLADVRPMYVELDPSWESRLYPHLVPHAFFSEFAPHPLGRSDRALGVESATNRLEELARDVRTLPGGDRATSLVLSAALSERAILLEALGDRETAERVTNELLELAPDHAVGRSLRRRFTKNQRDSLDVRALLASR